MKLFNKYNFSLSLCLMTLLMTSNALADSLDKLVKDIKEQAQLEARRDQEREQRFRASLSDQTQLLNEAQTAVSQAEKLRDQLRSDFDNNEVRLTELSELLTRRTGDLGELFGVFRQTSTDVQSIMFDSLASAENPSRKSDIAVLAEMSEVPGIESMESLWTLMLDEIAQSAKISSFESDIVKPSGEHYTSEVTRIGSFNVVANGVYLNYLPENDQLVEFARQPGGSVNESAADIEKAAAGDSVAFATGLPREFNQLIIFWPVQKTQAEKAT